MSIMKRAVVKTLVKGFKAAKFKEGVDRRKLDLCIEHSGKIADFVIYNQRNPSSEEIDELIGWKKTP